MTNKTTKILAIDPGIRKMGIAFLENGKLVYHDVKSIKKGSARATLQEGRKVILRLIGDYKPDTLAVEKTYFAHNRSMAVFNAFVGDIKAIGKRKRLKVVCYAPSTVKKFISGNGLATKYEIANVVISKFPELMVYASQNRKWKERYHQNMFDAVELGIMARERNTPK